MNIHDYFLTSKEAAKILGITSVRVSILCQDGRFNGAEKIGAVWFIPKDEVKNYKRWPRGRPQGSKKNIDKQGELR